MISNRDASVALLTFRWGEEVYAVPLAAVHEVARLGRVTPVPGGSRTVVGAIVLHGEVLPVADVRSLLGLAVEAEHDLSLQCANAGEVIVVRDQSNPAELVGLRVDAIQGICYVHEDQLRPQEGEPPLLSSGFLVGQIQSEECGVIRVLHLPQVLGALSGG